MEDRKAFVEIARAQEKSSASMTVTARSVLIALLTSPHFIYKAESPELTSVERAHRLSYFLWNSAPAAGLLTAARSGALGKDSSMQVERMLKDARAGRFIDDFTRQWLQLDKVSDFGPDVRVFKNVRRMTVDSMGREGRELFRHLLEKGLSMEHFIDSDFIMSNDRLARFYKLPAVEGDGFVPVGPASCPASAGWPASRRWAISPLTDRSPSDERTAWRDPCVLSFQDFYPARGRYRR